MENLVLFCQHCNKKLDPIKKGKKFCSETCRVRKWNDLNQRVEVIIFDRTDIAYGADGTIYVNGEKTEFQKDGTLRETEKYTSIPSKRIKIDPSK